MKVINLIGIIAMTYILANWWFTGDRPNDWYIAIMLVLYLMDRIIDFLEEKHGRKA